MILEFPGESNDAIFHFNVQSFASQSLTASLSIVVEAGALPKCFVPYMLNLSLAVVMHTLENHRIDAFPSSRNDRIKPVGVDKNYLCAAELVLVTLANLPFFWCNDGWIEPMDPLSFLVRVYNKPRHPFQPCC